MSNPTPCPHCQSEPTLTIVSITSVDPRQDFTPEQMADCLRAQWFPAEFEEHQLLPSSAESPTLEVRGRAVR